MKRLPRANAQTAPPPPLPRRRQQSQLVRVRRHDSRFFAGCYFIPAAVTTTTTLRIVVRMITRLFRLSVVRQCLRVVRCYICVFRGSRGSNSSRILSEQQCGSSLLRSLDFEVDLFWDHGFEEAGGSAVAWFGVDVF